MIKTPHKDNLVPYHVLLLKQIQHEGIREAIKLYKLTAGFTDPCPPSAEMRKMFEEGLIEL